MRRTIISATASIVISTTTLAQTAPPTGSAGACGTLYQQAASAAAARIAADDKDIAPPQAVKSLTCLDNILKGVGLNVVVNLLDPTTLFNSIEGQLCNAVTNAWKKTLGSAQCGITLSGFNLGAFNFGGNLGGGLSCPKLSFGSEGPPVGSIGIGGAGGNGSLYVNGSGRAPTGYTLPNTIGLW